MKYILFTFFFAFPFSLPLPIITHCTHCTGIWIHIKIPELEFLIMTVHENKGHNRYHWFKIPHLILTSWWSAPDTYPFPKGVCLNVWLYMYKQGALRTPLSQYCSPNSDLMVVCASWVTANSGSSTPYEAWQSRFSHTIRFLDCQLEWYNHTIQLSNTNLFLLEMKIDQCWKHSKLHVHGIFD